MEALANSLYARARAVTTKPDDLTLLAQIQKELPSFDPNLRTFVTIAHALRYGTIQDREAVKAKYPRWYRELYKVHGFKEFASEHGYRTLGMHEDVVCACCKRQVPTIDGHKYKCTGCYTLYCKKCLSQRLYKMEGCLVCDAEL